MSPARVLVGLACLLAACGGRTSQGGADASGPDAATSCSVPDAGTGSCTFAAHDLACSGGGCLSDDFVCPGLGADAGCTNRCNAGETAAWCGGMTAAPAPPSPDCRSVGNLPSGMVEYCCPCGP